jgi:hypothetical protein
MKCVPTSSGLHDTLRRNEVEMLVHNARLTRDWPDCQEKLDEASRQAHMALYKHALQEISDEERDCILEILRPCCPDLFAPVAPPSDRDWQLPIVVE